MNATRSEHRNALLQVCIDNGMPEETTVAEAPGWLAEVLPQGAERHEWNKQFEQSKETTEEQDHG
jgi:hypothetical protein